MKLIEHYKKGNLNEIFGMGTAAVISMIEELKYKDTIMKFDVHSFTIAKKVKQQLNNIRHGKTSDTYGWMLRFKCS